MVDLLKYFIHGARLKNTSVTDGLETGRFLPNGPDYNNNDSGYLYGTYVCQTKEF